jgi:glycine/D-amino acid oxidase-like deaminating enzyme
MKRKALILGRDGIVGVAAFIALVRRGAANVIELVNPGPPGLGKAFATTESACSPTRRWMRCRLSPTTRMTSYMTSYITCIIAAHQR